jgi:ribosomal protein S1
MEGTGRIVAQKSGAVLSIGDRVKVQITAIDLPTRQMELGIIQMPTRHVEDVSEPHGTQRKSKKLGAKKPKSKSRGRDRRGT